MADVRLERDYVTIDGTISILGPDIKLSKQDRRKSTNRAQNRRALVHGQEDTLIVNYGNDYLGVEINGGREGIRLNGKIKYQDGDLIETIAVLKSKVAALERQLARA